MTQVLYLDSETFSPVPITHGTDRYSDQVEVMLVTYAWNDDEVQVIEDPARGDVEDLITFADLVVIQNSWFDRTVFRKVLGVDIPTAKIFDTMAGALSHSLPGSLGLLCEILGVPIDEAKDKSGKQLIQLFCKPRPKTSKLRRATKHSHPHEWARFVEYAMSDITAMRSVYKKLPKWNYDIGRPEHTLWQLDQKINDRGVRVDQELALAAIEASKKEKDLLNARTAEMTRGEVQRTTQRDLLLKHLLAEYEIDLPDMTKATLERRLEDPDLPEPVRELLSMRLLVSTTSASKYKRLLDCVGADGFLRGLLQFCGALRTGRWAGRMFQPQNLPRPVLEHIAATLGCSLKEAEEDARMLEYIELGISALKGGYADIVISNVILLCINLIRSAVHAREGHKLVVSDLANIEGRALAWLAGEQWKLDAFNDYDAGVGPDLYKLAFARSFRVAPEVVTKDQRQIGKVQELALGYQGAVGAFSKMAALYGVELPDEEVLRIVKAWRKAHPATTKFWYGVEEAARSATETPGEVFEISKLKFKRDGAWLKMRLPSDRLLCYPSPRIENVKSPCPKCDGDKVIELKPAEATENVSLEPVIVQCPACKGSGFKWRSQLTYLGVNQYTRKWERIKTYGGKLVENATQATARDVMASGMIAADRAGFAVLLSVHDELICEAPTGPMFTALDLEEIMSRQISWTAGLPLAASGFEAERYRK